MTTTTTTTSNPNLRRPVRCPRCRKLTPIAYADIWGKMAWCVHCGLRLADCRWLPEPSKMPDPEAMMATLWASASNQ